MISEQWGEKLDEWNRIVDECELTVAGISRRFDIAYASLNNWIKGNTIPREKSKKRMEEVLVKLKETKRIPYHPSFGYATAEQIDKLKKPISGYERDQIMAQIEKQTKHGGKID